VFNGDEEVTTQEEQVVEGNGDEEEVDAENPDSDEATDNDSDEDVTVCDSCGETIADAELADHVRSHKKNGKAKATSAVKATVDPARPNRVVLDRWPTEEEKKAARGE